MEVVERYLPDWCYSSRRLSIEGICIHYLSAINVAPDRPFCVDTNWNLLIELNRPGPERGPLLERDEHPRAYASYHLLVDRDGNKHKLVPYSQQAYHAGVSEWGGRKNCNGWMLGVAALATHTSGFTDPQYEALIEISRWARAKGQFGVGNITGHEHVAPGRKVDPGPLFDWNRLRAAL